LGTQSSQVVGISKQIKAAPFGAFIPIAFGKKGFSSDKKVAPKKIFPMSPGAYRKESLSRSKKKPPGTLKGSTNSRNNRR
jgi:hypothetical protein